MAVLSCYTSCDKDLTEIRWVLDLPAEYNLLMMFDKFKEPKVQFSDGAVSNTKYSSNVNGEIISHYTVNGTNNCFLKSVEEIIGELSEIPNCSTDDCNSSPLQIPEVSVGCYNLQSVLHSVGGVKSAFPQLCSDKYSLEDDVDKVDAQILSAVLKTCVTSFFTRLYDPYFVNCIQYLPWEVPTTFRMPPITYDATTTGLTRQVLQEIKNAILERSIKYNSHSSRDLLLLVPSNQMTILRNSYLNSTSCFTPEWFGASNLDRSYHFTQDAKDSFIDGIRDNETGIRVYSVSSERIGRITAAGTYNNDLLIRGLDLSNSSFVVKDTVRIPTNGGTSLGSVQTMGFMSGNSTTMNWTYSVNKSQHHVGGHASGMWSVIFSCGIFNFRAPLNVNIIVKPPTGSAASIHTPKITDFTPTPGTVITPTSSLSNSIKSSPHSAQPQPSKVSAQDSSSKSKSH